MSDIPPVADDEVILRHIPGGTTFQAPGSRVTSRNFRPRSVLGESDVSVNRLRFTSPEQLLTRVGGDVAKGSRVAWATSGEVRAVGLRVEATPKEDDPGHASIQSTDSADLTSLAVQRTLSNLFRFVETHPLPGTDARPDAPEV